MLNVHINAKYQKPDYSLKNIEMLNAESLHVN